MDIVTFIQGLKFLNFQPLDLPSEGEPDQQEFANTCFAYRDAEFKARIGMIWDMPKMSTLAIGGLINYAVSQMASDQAFLNIGTWHGFSLFSGMVGHPDKICWGVDNFSQLFSFGLAHSASVEPYFTQRFDMLKSNLHHFVKQDYQTFFASKIMTSLPPIGVYFYDGNHSYTDQLRGLQIAEPYLSSEALIFIDDINLNAAHQATYDFMAQSVLGYRVLMEEKTLFDWHPTYWNGLMILQRDPSRDKNAV